MSTAAATVRAAVRAAQPRAASPSGRRPHLRVVGEPRHGMRYVVVALVVGGLGVFGVVGLHALAAEQSFEVRNLEREVRDLSLAYDELTAEIARLESPERVRQVAMGQLGMVPAGSPGFLLAEDDASQSGSGDDDLTVARGTLPPSDRRAAPVADPVKQVLAEGP